MGVSLRKNDRVSLAKLAPTSQKFTVGLGWDPIEKKGFFGSIKKVDVDCDASAYIVGSRPELVFFAHSHSNDGALYYPGDNRTGDGDGDDEVIHIDTSKINANVTEIIVGVNIYGSASNGKHFGMLKNAYIRMLDTNNNEICRYDLTGSEFNGKTAVIMGKLVRTGNTWDFQAIGTGNNADTAETMYK